MLFSPNLSNIITIINSVFWDVALCSSMNRSQHFKTQRLNLQGLEGSQNNNRSYLIAVLLPLPGENV